MLAFRLHRTRRAARSAIPPALAVALTACTVGSEEDTGVASDRELGNAASRISAPLSNPVRVTRPANEGVDQSAGTAVAEVDPPVTVPPSVPPVGGTDETVLDRLQTRFRSAEDADFWACVVFSPRSVALAYNFIGNIGVSVTAPLADDAGEPVVRSYVVTVTDVNTVMLDFEEVDEAEELSQITVTGTGPDASLDMFSSTWGTLSCTILNTGEAS